MSNIKKNFIYNVLYQILVFLLPLITTPYLSRVLGAEKTGIYSFAHSIAYYFVMFAMLGLNNYGNREIAGNRDDISRRSQKFWSIYMLQLLTSCITICTYILYCLIAKMNDVISWILLLYVVSAALDINWFFWGLEEFKITVTRNTIIKIISVISIFIFVKTRSDLAIYTFIMASSTVLSQLLLFPYLAKRIKWYRPSLNEVLYHVKPNLILFIPIVAISLYKVMDKVMLGKLTSFDEVGFYEYSEKVIAIPIACVNALGTVMLPRMSNLISTHQNNKENVIIKKSIVIGVALAISMGFGLMGIAEYFVPFFYGAGYHKCVYLFYILMPSCAFLAVANILRTQFLIPRKRDKEYITSVIIGAIVNLVINFVLIPRLQSIGAAIGTLIAEGSVCIYQMYVLRCELPIGDYIKTTVELAIIGCGMLLAVLLTPTVGSLFITICIKIIVGIMVFGILFYIRYKKLVLDLIRSEGS